MENVLFQSLEDLSERLRRQRYITTPATVAALFVATRLSRPVLLEGLPGAGKTELAMALAEAMATELVRLQCCDGIRTEQAMGTFDHHLQYVYLRLRYQHDRQVPAPGQLASMVYTTDFLIKGPILDAILRPKPVVLLIDEIDKVSGEFESVLLEFLTDWAVSLPQMGQPIKAVSKPVVILTSNGARELTEPLLRRCVYLWLEYPLPKEEVEILEMRGRRPHPILDTQIAGHAVALRNNLLEKPPSVSEMLMLKEALTLLGIDEIKPEHRDLVLPYVIKKKRDLDKITKMDHEFESLVANTNRWRDQLVNLRAAEAWQQLSKAHEETFNSQLAAYEKTLAEMKQSSSWTEAPEETPASGQGTRLAGQDLGLGALDTSEERKVH